jgi:hypothetical protein
MNFFNMRVFPDTASRLPDVPRAQEISMLPLASGGEPVRRTIIGRGKTLLGTPITHRADFLQ